MKRVLVGGQKGYLVGGTMYRTKKDLADAVRRVLYSYEAGATVSDEHFAFLLDLLSHHPKVSKKIDRVCAFEVRRVPGFEHVCAFWIVYDDGRAAAWSTADVISPPSPLARVRRVFRYTIVDQLREFKASWFRENAEQEHFTCAVTGEKVSAERAHVDHEAPHTFDALMRAFIESRGFHIESIELCSSKDDEVGRRFADEILAQDWYDYHRMHAHLRVISDTANMSHAKKRSASRAG